MKIKTTHIGEDYATIKVNTKEYQVSRGLGEHIHKLTHAHIYKTSTTSRTKKCMTCGVTKKDI